MWVDNNFSFFKVLQHRIKDYRTLPNQATAIDEQIIRELVAADQGVAIMQEDETCSLVESGQVTILNKGWAENPLCLGWASGRQEEKSIKEAREVIN